MSGIRGTLDGGGALIDEMLQHYAGIAAASAPGWFITWIAAYNIWGWNNLVAVATPLILLPWMGTLDYAFDNDTFANRLGDDCGGIPSDTAAKALAAYYTTLSALAILLAALVDTYVTTGTWWISGTYAAGVTILADRILFDSLDISPVAAATAALLPTVAVGDIPVDGNLGQYAMQKWEIGEN